MYFLKEVNEFFGDLYAMVNVNNYIISDKYNPGRVLPWIGAYNIYNILNAAQEMYVIKTYYNALSGKYIRHFVMSFEDSDYFTVADAIIMAVKVCGYFCGGFQVVYAVHQNTKHLHIHFVVNTTSFVDGKRLSDSYEDRAQFKKYVRKCYNQVRSESGKFINNFKRQQREAWG